MNHNRKIIYLAGFLFSMPVALVSYINSSLLETYVGKNYVGIIYIIASLLTIASLSKMPKILTRLGARLTTIIFSMLILLSFLMLAFGNSGFIVIPAFVLFFASNSFIITSLDVFIEDFSKKSSIGKMRGIYLTVINGAWILAQIISGSIISKSSFSGIYLLSTGFMILMFIVFVLFLHDFKDPEYKKISISKTIRSFIHNKNISKIYLSNLILQFFYASMVIYSPIYLHEYMGFGWSQIGFIFSIMLIPFVALDFPLGKLSDKIGERKMLIIGYFIIAISVLIIPFITKSTLWIWATVLFASRVGAATIEVMNDSYFFKEIKEEDADEISFFRNAPSVSYILAPLVVATLLLFVIPSFEYIFFALGAILLVGFFISLRLRDVK